MVLKDVVDGLLKEKTRTLTWLAIEMGKTFDGLKLSLVRGSIKYNDIITMAEVLNVPPSIFFHKEPISYTPTSAENIVGDQKAEYSDLKNNLKNCREMVTTLKEQIKDKDKIISLMSKED